MKKPRFTGNEDRALIQIASEMERIKWSKVVEKLEERGFPARTEKSVRNRYLRLRVQEQLRRVEPDRRKINRCKTCGLFMRGHVCGGLQGPNEGESVSGDVGGGVGGDCSGGDVSEGEA
jgi:hypothetical protein